MKLFYLLYLLPLYSCSQNSKDSNKFIVTVKIDALKRGDSVYLSYSKYKQGNMNRLVDTNIYWSDKLIFEGEIPEPVEAKFTYVRMAKVDTVAKLKFLHDLPYSIQEKKEMEKELLNPRKVESFIFLLAPGETEISNNSINDIIAKGNDAVEIYSKLKQDYQQKNIERLLQINRKFNLLLNINRSADNKMIKAVDSIYNLSKKEVYFKFAIDNPKSLVSLFALQFSIHNGIENIDHYIDAFHKLSPSIRKWESAKELLGKLNRIKSTEIGNTIHDFKQIDTAGKVVNYSMYKGKYILIEMWANWCVPCLKKNPQLREIQEKYAGKNFTIVGIALENESDKDKWLSAIKKDSLTWPQLTDFKGWENSVARFFCVESIPFNVLIDPNGKILRKNLYNHELNMELEKLLN